MEILDPRLKPSRSKVILDAPLKPSRSILQPGFGARRL
jgi:hypothetical protein